MQLNQVKNNDKRLDRQGGACTNKQPMIALGVDVLEDRIAPGNLGFGGLGFQVLRPPSFEDCCD